MANKPGHRRFGNVRRLPSGRYQVRYLGLDGLLRKAPETFERKRDAERYLTLVEAQLVRGEWVDPARGQVRLGDYAETWIAQRPGLRPRTVDLYRWLLRKHIAPYLGSVAIARIDTEMVRQWRATLLGRGVSTTVVAKAYRLLRAVLMTAANEDRIISGNPCRLRGAADEKSPERPVLTVTQVFELADRMRDRRFRALVLLATFASLRWGEVTALRRSDVDVTSGTVRIRAAFVERHTGELVSGAPKSRAGRRVVSIPAAILPDVGEHLDQYAAPGPEGLVFPGAKGPPLRCSNFNKAANWKEVVVAIGVPHLHFHDLRHTGNMLAARGGAGLKDLMARMGHDNVRAALIYQHASTPADRAIAEALSKHIEEEQQRLEEGAGNDGVGRPRKKG